MDSNSDSDDSTGGSSRVLEWEVVSSDPDCGGGGSGSGDTNGNGHDGEVHEQDVALHLHHFGVSQTSESEQQQESSTSGKDSGAETRVVRDWVEPSTSGYNKEDAEQPATKDDSGSVNRQLDLDLDSGMFATLVSSVLESGGSTSPIKRNLGVYSGGTLAEVESLASLQRELLSEAGFCSLVPSDIHGNVLRPEDQDETLPVEDDDEDGGVLKSWRRKLLMWRDYIQRASTLWSLTIAAALMGLVIIGQRWHHERWQNQQLRLQLCCKDEKISQLLFQIARLKEAVSGRRRVPVIKASSM